MSETNGLSKLPNRPGLSSLNYRVGDYGAFRNYLLAQLSRLLPSLKTRDSDDPAIALLDSWAVVADVLTFYQERIINEAYLRTATERQSMIELARLIGYELKPGVSASTHLAFTIEDKPGGLPQVTIPRGTQVMSIPGEGELPQMFETREDLLAAPVWNALKPRLAKPQEITRTTRKLYLQGATPQLAAGDWLLLTGTVDQREQTFLLRLKTVEPDLVSSITTITWDYDLQQLEADTSLRNPQVFAFRQQAGLFGNHAPQWNTTPDDLKRKSPDVQIRGGVFVANLPPSASPSAQSPQPSPPPSPPSLQWTSISSGLPNQDIQCLAATKDYRFAGTEGSGIFRSSGMGSSWKPVNEGLTNLNIQTLHVVDADRGHLLAGTTGGGVFRSRDNGETWSLIRTGSVRLRKDGDLVHSVNTGIPDVVVRSLLAYPIEQGLIIFAGTDDDVYRTMNQGQDWSSHHTPLDGDTYRKLQGIPNRLVQALIHVPKTLNVVTGRISKVDSEIRYLIQDASETLAKDAILFVKGRSFKVKETINKATVRFNEDLPEELKSRTFTYAKGGSGKIVDIDKINAKKASVSELNKALSVGDSITFETTVDGQTKTSVFIIEQILEYTVETANPRYSTEDLSGCQFSSSSMLLFAGTDRGAYYSDNHGETWNLINPSSTDQPGFYSFSYVDIDGSSYVLAGTSNGVLQCKVSTSPLSWVEAGLNQKQGDPSSPAIPVRSLQLVKHGTELIAFAATDQGIYAGTQSADGWSWSLSDQNNPLLKNITSIAIHENQILAGAKFTGFADVAAVKQGAIASSEQTEWPNFHVQKDWIDLDTLYPKILPDSWALLVNQSQIPPENPSQILPPHAPVRVERIATEQRQGYGLDTKVTRLLPAQPIDHPTDFHLRTTVALAQSEALPLAEIRLTVPVQQEQVFQDPIWDNRIFLNQYVHGLEAKKTVIVSGKHIRARVHAGGIFQSRNWKWLSSDLMVETLQAMVFREADQQWFAVTQTGGETRVWRSPDGGQRWQPLSREGLGNATILTLTIYQNTINATLTSEGRLLQGRSRTSPRPRTVREAFGVNIQVGDLIHIRSNGVSQPRYVTRIPHANRPIDLEMDAGYGINLSPGSVAESVSKLLIGTDQGLYRLKGSVNWKDITWEKVDRPDIQNQPIHRILVNPKDHSIFVATQTKRLFRSFDDGQIWKQVDRVTGKEQIFTLVANQNGDIFVGTERDGVFHLSRDGSIWEPVNTHLKDFSVLSLVVDPVTSDLYAGTATQGVFRLPVNITNPARTNWMYTRWEPMGQGFGDEAVDTLYFSTQTNGDYLIASTTGGSVVRLQIRPASRGRFGSQMKLNDLTQQVWEAIDVGLEGAIVQRLTVDSQNQLLAGTPNGVFQWLQPTDANAEVYWEHRHPGFTNNSVQALMGYRVQGHLRLVAGTQGGLFTSRDQGKTWAPMNFGLKHLEVQTLLAIASSPDTVPQAARETGKTLFAGTKEGLFVSTDEGKHWQTVDLGRPRLNVQALTQHPSSQSGQSSGQSSGVRSDLFAGTLNTGLLRSPDGIHWTGVGLTKQDIRVLLSRKQQKDLLVGTAGSGIWRSQTDGNTWEHWTDTRPGHGTLSSNGVVVTGVDTRFSVELKSGDKIESNGQVRTVVRIEPEASTQLTVDTAFKPALQSARFVIHTGLDNLYINSLIALDNGLFAGTAGSGVFRSENNGQRWQPINEGLQNLEIRCLSTDPITRRLYAGTATGGVFRLSVPAAAPDANNRADWTWEPINQGLSNTDVRVILVEAGNLYLGGVGTLSSPDGLDFVELQPDDLLRVVTAPRSLPLTDGQAIAPRDQPTEWQVLDRNNVKRKLVITQSRDIRLEPAAEEDPVVSEIAVIQVPPTDEDRPIVLLQDPLKHSYDPATVKVYANVVAATHGETTREILGSGNGAMANQRFILSKPPLTHVADPGPRGSKSELKVYVNEVQWTEVPSLYPLDKQDRSYILQIEDDGTTSITFGDGQRGARLPSGRENITATYRSGIGAAGNTPAERISLKKTGPASIQAVTNPLPATGGAAGESLASARSTVPATTRTLDRIVSRRDFEDFTQAFAGIGKAAAVVLWNGTSEIIHITIAGVNGAEVLPESALYKNLVAAIDAARDPVQPVQVNSFTRLFFKLEARVKHQEGYQADKVEAAIRKQLLDTFAFERRSLGQPVTQSEVIAAIQSVAGVQALDLDFLYRQDASRTLQSSLTATSAVWDFDTNRANPAQLLMLPPGGITLTVEPTL